MPNSTDAMKKLVIEMFAEPINEVEEAFDNFLNSSDAEYGLRLDALRVLQQKISALKSKLPTEQE